jgi:hypothetical protein
MLQADAGCDAAEATVRSTDDSGCKYTPAQECLISLYSTIHAHVVNASAETHHDRAWGAAAGRFEMP